MNFIKQIIPLNLKVKIVKKYNNYKLNKKYKIINNEKKIFIIGSPHHGNLGDHAITDAQISLLKDNLKDYKFVEVMLKEYYEQIKYIKKYITNSDIITINGGGNFGNQYIFDENIRRNVINNFPNNKIILFPQTMYFTNDEVGKNELNKTKEIYNKHKNLILVAREKKSYNDMKKHFNNKLILTPDIVLYLQKSVNYTKRKGALYCMRSDIESNLSDNEKEFILQKLKESYNNVNITDTVVNTLVSKEEREQYLENKFSEFRNAEIVITDRIHGMIFAAITGTPCIALSNYNHKVIGTYEWIKNLTYIKFIDDINKIQENINSLKHLNEVTYDNKIFTKYYDEIISEII